MGRGIGSGMVSAAIAATLLFAAPAGAAPAARLAEARAAERAGAPAEERAACLALIAGWPEAPEARPCRARLDQLQRRADLDGGLDDLQLLTDVQRGRAPPAALDALARWPGHAPDLAVEAALLLAQNDAQRGDAEAVSARLAPLWAALGGEVALDPAVRLRLGERLAAAWAAQGEEARAAAIFAAKEPPRSARPLEGAPLARARRRDQGADRGAGLVAALGALGLAWRGRLGAPRGLGPPMGAGLLLGITVLCALLAGAWEPGLAAPTAALGLGLVAAHLLAARALSAAPPTGALRFGVGLWTAALVWLGAGWLGLPRPGVTP